MSKIQTKAFAEMMLDSLKRLLKNQTMLMDLYSWTLKIISLTHTLMTFLMRETVTDIISHYDIIRR